MHITNSGHFYVSIRTCKCCGRPYGIVGWSFPTRIILAFACFERDTTGKFIKKAAKPCIYKDNCKKHSHKCALNSPYYRKIKQYDAKAIIDAINDGLNDTEFYFLTSDSDVSRFIVKKLKESPLKTRIISRKTKNGKAHKYIKIYKIPKSAQ